MSVPTRLVRSLLLVVALCVASLIMSCDPNKEIGAFFKQRGLNRLAIARDDVEPAGLVLVGGGKAVYETSLYDWVDGEAPPLATTAAAKSNEYSAVLGSYKGNRSVSANLAIQFLKTVLPVDITGNLGLANDVTIDPINAKSLRMSPAAIEKYIQSPAAAPLRSHLKEAFARGQRAYVVYEVYSTPTLKMESSANADVSSAIAADAIKPISKGSVSFTVKREGKSSLIINGTHPYAFAVRAAQIVPSKVVANQYVLDVTNYPTPADVKAAGTEAYNYTAPLAKSFEDAVTLSRM